MPISTIFQCKDHVLKGTLLDYQTELLSNIAADLQRCLRAADAAHIPLAAIKIAEALEIILDPLENNKNTSEADVSLTKSIQSEYQTGT